MTTWADCPTCAGTGQVEKPSLREKVARHLIFAAANKAQVYGLALTPDEVTELGTELGILPPPPPEAEAEPAEAAAQPAVAIAEAPGYPPVSPDLHAALSPDVAAAAEAAGLVRRLAPEAAPVPSPFGPQDPPVVPPPPPYEPPPVTAAPQQWAPIEGPPPSTPEPPPPVSLTGPPGGR